ncbi:MAG: SIR2 family protein [Flavobacteriaceae bacterium]|nr:SIR2 family protein [Flavobacteriaceae bacterium]
MIKAFQEEDISLFKKFPKAIIHLRSEFQRERLSLTFGAGLSKGFAIPDWKGLVKRIENHNLASGVRRKELDLESLTAKVEILQRCFSKFQSIADKMEIKGKWYQILRNLIYQDVAMGKDFDLKHPYICEFLKIIIESPVTITYNFDSCIEMSIDSWAIRNKIDIQHLYETIFPNRLPTKSKGSIYHVNGYLPANPLDTFSEDLVFTEQQYAEQILESTAGRYATLAHYFATNTCLFIGLSLSDENLRYMLRKSALNNPGHYHYYIQYQDSEVKQDPNFLQTLEDYYFDAYNLITLLLGDKEIKSLGKLITCEFEELNELVKGEAPLKWLYYITGIPSSGKTSIRNSMRGLRLYPEWQTKPPELMKKPHTQLTEKQREEIDGWTADQFKRKNERLEKETEGIFVIDRGPLDPLSFTKKEDLKDKIPRYWNYVSPSFGKPIQPGYLILLKGNVREISSRLARKTGTKESKLKYLKELQEFLVAVYDLENTIIIDTTNKSLCDVVKRVSEIVFREEYKPVAFNQSELVEKWS